MKTKHIVAIVVAGIGAAGLVASAIIGAAWGKNNIDLNLTINDREVIINDKSDIEDLASDNEELNNLVATYEAQIQTLEDERNELTEKLGNANGELDEVPSIEFRNLGLSIDGEEQSINRDKSSVYINGFPYYLQDFVDSLLPDNMAVTRKDDMLYIGKIVHAKSNLFDMPVIEKGYYNYFYDSLKDTYGNIHSRALMFEYHNYFTTFNANREYAYLKCTVAMEEGHRGKGSIQIKADGNTIYNSAEITNITEPFEIDIPINQASTLTFGTIGDSSYGSHILIADAILYNQE